MYAPLARSGYKAKTRNRAEGGGRKTVKSPSKRLILKNNNKPDTKGQVLYEPTHEAPRAVTFIHRKHSLPGTGGAGVGVGV